MKTSLDNTNFNHDNKQLDGEALKMRETRLNKELKAGTITPDGEKELKEIKKKLQHARNIINNGKEITKDVDYRNTFRKEQKVMNVNSASVSKKSDKSGDVSNILSNKQAMKEEISSIRYLIEYMNNNNNNNKKQNL
jgi:hypothetical protein